VPNVEVFFEAVWLEQVGEFEGADVAAAFSDLPLQVNHDPAEVLQREARAPPFKPLPLPVKTQAQVLTGQLAVELVSGGDLLQHIGRHDLLRIGRWQSKE
jgi:hypothetical protein